MAHAFRTSTYGDIRLRLVKANAGVDPELIDGWIQDRYHEILDRLPWKRAETTIVIQSPDSYTDGTVTTVRGSATLTGDSTVWTSSMTGLMIRINNEEEYYEVEEVVSATEITLDRPYERTGAADLDYRIDQPIFVMPAECRVISSVVPNQPGTAPLKVVSPAELDRINPRRNEYGTPKYAAFTFDNFSDPPRMQIELFPVPDSPNATVKVMSWEVTYVFEARTLTGHATTTTLLPWVRPAALIKGVEADIADFKNDDAKFKRASARFDQLLDQMIMTDSLQQGPQQIRIAREYRRLGPVDVDVEDHVTILPE